MIVHLDSAVPVPVPVTVPSPATADASDVTEVLRLSPRDRGIKVPVSAMRAPLSTLSRPL